MSYSTLLDRCDVVFDTIKVTDGESKAVESATRNQSSSSQWFAFRAGRITASKLRSATHTDVSQPSSSLIRSICYPEAYRFSTVATSWGIEREKTARGQYVKSCSDKHIDLKVRESGFVISTAHSFLGATPDGIITCNCCGYGVLEVKCPFKCTTQPFSTLVSDKAFCLEEVDGKYALRKDRQYSYQVQAQMFVCDAKYCDFVVWSPDELAVVHVLPDHSFMASVLEKSKTFKIGVLLELVGKWHTKSFTNTVTAGSNATSSELADTIAVTGSAAPAICSCKQAKHGPIIECAQDQCPIK